MCVCAWVSIDMSMCVYLSVSLCLTVSITQGTVPETLSSAREIMLVSTCVALFVRVLLCKC